MRCCLLTACLLSVASWMVPGRALAFQDETTASDAETPAAATPPAPTAADSSDAAGDAAGDAAEMRQEWDALNARRMEIAVRLNQLKKEFGLADINAQRKIKSEFEKLLFEFRNELLPKLVELAPVVYEADPSNVSAGEFVLRDVWQRRNVARAAEIADQLLAAGADSAFILNTAGEAHCELGEFQKAAEVLKAAEAQGRLEPAGTRCLELATAYLDYAQDPQSVDVEALDLLVEDAYRHNRYRQAIDIATAAIADGHKTEAILSFLGAAHFALNQFEQAQQVFAEAEEADKLNFTAQDLQNTTEEYIKYWQEEQALREQEANAAEDEQLPHVLLKTTRGDIEVALTENEAPNTVANFVNLVQNGKYDGVAFHRVVPNFVIQGGDPNTLDSDPGNDGMGGPGYTIDCECWEPDARKHFRGSLSMAHSGRDTGGSQFFITHCPTPHLNADKASGNGHTVFGYVVNGMDVVDTIRQGDKIVEAKVLSKRDHEYKPKTNQTSE